MTNPLYDDEHTEDDDHQFGGELDALGGDGDDGDSDDGDSGAFTHIP